MDNSTNATDANPYGAWNAAEWLNRGDNAWQLTAATLVGLQSVPGLVIMYGSVVKKKWAVNSAFMALYAFAAVLICWVCWGYKMSFGHQAFPLWGRAGPALGQSYLTSEAVLSSVLKAIPGTAPPNFPMATMVYFQFVFAAITLVLLAGALLGRTNFLAWMLFVPLWLTFSYTFVCYSIWGGGFLFKWGVIDYSGGYVIHVSSGTAGFVAAYWVGPRLKRDRERFPPNNVILTLCGAGLLWMGWNGFNGGDPYNVNYDASLAVLNTNICTAVSLFIWTMWDIIFFHKASVIGSVQGMITGLVVITPCAGVIEGWAAIIAGVAAGSVPWFTMMILGKKYKLFDAVDDTLEILHTHCISGVLGGIITGLFAQKTASAAFGLAPGTNGAIYGGWGQLGKQIVGAMFVVAWNIVVTSLICLAIKLVVPLRMSDEHLEIGDYAVHGEDAYSVWGDGEMYDATKHGYGYDITHHGGNVNLPAKDGVAGAPSTSEIKKAEPEAVV